MNYTKPGFATEDEIKMATIEVELSNKKQLGNVYSGTMVRSDGEKMLVLPAETHSIAVSTSGSGKTRCVIMPSVLQNAKAENSMIITDIKGEIHKELGNYLRLQGYNVIVIDFDDPVDSTHYNVLSPIEQLYKNGRKKAAGDLLADVSEILMSGLHSEKDPYWEITAQELFCGIANFILSIGESLTLSNMWNVYEHASDNRRGFKQMLQMEKTKFKNALIGMNSFLVAPADTANSISAVFSTGMNRLIQNDDVRRMVSTSDFEFRSVIEDKTAIFLKTNELSLASSGSLLSAIVRVFYAELIYLASQTESGSLQRQVSFLLDEFGNMPAISHIDQMVSLSRSRNIFFTLCLQSYAQLRYRYGDEIAKVIEGCTPNWVYLYSPEQELLNKISKIAGSYTDDDGVERPVISVSQLRQFVKKNAMGCTQALVISAGRLRPVITYLPDISMYPCLKEATRVARQRSKKKERELTKSMGKNKYVLDVSMAFRR